MVLDLISRSLGISSRKLWISSLINSSIISWYLFLAHINMQNIFQNFTSQESWILVASSSFYFSGVLSAIIGSTLSNRIDRKKLLWVWTTLGVISSGLLIFFQNEFYILIFGPLLGISLGFGFPYCSSLFVEYTTVENRGRVGGIIIFLTFFMLSLARIVTDILGSSLIAIIAVLILLRSTSFLALIADKYKIRNKVLKRRKKENNWFSIITHKKYVLYYFPWTLFIVTMVVTDHILWQELPKTLEYNMVFEVGYPLHYLGVIIFSIISGIIGDRIGRKPPILIGLIMMGFSFALMGLSTTPVSVFVHLVALGVAFGFIWPMYNAIPGDIANSNRPYPFAMERIYAIIQFLPWIVYGTLGSLPQAFGISAPPTVLAPFLSIILFISTLPIFLAPETLPQKIVKKREQDKHLKELKKLIEEEGHNY